MAGDFIVWSVLFRCGNGEKWVYAWCFFRMWLPWRVSAGDCVVFCGCIVGIIAITQCFFRKGKACPDLVEWMPMCGDWSWAGFV